MIKEREMKENESKEDTIIIKIIYKIIKKKIKILNQINNIYIIMFQ